MAPHVHYVEPFCGSCALVFARDPDDLRFFLSDHRDHRGVSEVVNDLDGRLTNFWRVLKDDDLFARFRRQAEAIPVSRPEWEAAHRHEYGNDPVADAVAFFVDCRQSRQALMKGFITHVKNRTRRGRNDHAAAWLSAVDGLADAHQRMRRVVVENMDAALLIRKHDAPGTLFYCDPPYLHETRTARKAYGPFEMTEAQHRELLGVLRECKGKVMLSGYPSELYDLVLSDWTRLTFDVDHKSSGSAVKERKTEVLWLNYTPAGKESRHV
jgi:DNA adenine methylase